MKLRRPSALKQSDVVALCLIAFALLSFCVDIQFARNFTPSYIPGEVRIALHKAESFGHGYGVLLIIVTAWVLTQCRLRELWPMAACSFGAGVTADAIKLSVPRARPHVLIANPSIETSFAGVMPWMNESWSRVLDAAHQSFPSAHTATAVGLAVALACYYPEGKRWFLLLAGLVAVQRVIENNHFPSDVLVGAAIGILFATRVVQVDERVARMRLRGVPDKRSIRVDSKCDSPNRFANAA